MNERARELMLQGCAMFVGKKKVERTESHVIKTDENGFDILLRKYKVCATFSKEWEENYGHVYRFMYRVYDKKTKKLLTHTEDFDYKILNVRVTLIKK